MFIEATLALQTDIIETKMEREILREAKMSICDPYQKFVDAEEKEDRHTRELFEKLLETIERDSWRRWDLNPRR